MKCKLLNVLPSFVKTVRASEILLGPIFTRLINIVEAMHTKKLIMVDVNPDNLMIDSNYELPTVVQSKTTITTKLIAQSIRLVDFELVKSIAGTTGVHIEDIPTSMVQGTPLYASLHVHNLHTPSRRDDVYAMLYVIGEIILFINGLICNKSAPYGMATDSPSYFPWSQETDIESMGKVKMEQMKTIESDYFASMPNNKIAKVLFSIHKQVHDTTFDQAPDYDTIRTLLATIKILIPATFNATNSAEKSTGALLEPPLQKSKSRPLKKLKMEDIDMSFDSSLCDQNDENDVDMMNISG
jgi:serine/threonine protein kinase